MTIPIRCPRCDRGFDEMGFGSDRTEIVCWCSECEHAYSMQMTDLGLDPIQMKYDCRTQWKVTEV